MKIAQVCPRYFPDVGGVETVVKEMSERLSQKGFVVDVICQDPLKNYPPVQVINDVTVRRFQPNILGWDSPLAKHNLRSFLIENSSKYDIIHAHSYHAPPALYAAMAKRNSKLIFNPHYHGKGHTWLMSLLHIPYRSIGKTIFEKADKIICVSQTEKSVV